MLVKEKIIGLPVYTQSGKLLGKVIDLESAPQSELVIRYIVEPDGLIKNIIGVQLSISPQQIISLTEEKMIVEDNCQKIKSQATLSA
ncbi:MAG: PRC-barrel domain-containing protein [Patescibacteria group bacterium]|nr:PRC-barrel domain-containing protein [Patescibacteria group bacterium]MDD5121082.1 PRC-barrel domain-containing protein [Patescibacteria group bacterium]MDD5221988.1 PRC-barrel domain-containing protein [Patescibacteria group bacterium]MDD5395999.1 PRC-barrel domain-containing protein [Patescibacteria group bacterium]